MSWKGKGGRSITIVVLALLFAVPQVQADGWWGYRELKKAARQVSREIDTARPVTVPATGEIEVAFSPNEGSEALVLKVIDSARQSIEVLAYSFTSAPVTKALLKAKQRGVQVFLVVDYKDNVVGGEAKNKSRAALSALVNAGCDVRTISVYAIHHDKVILVDGRTVETGSFNFSSAAAHKNSENVIVNWNNPQLFQVYQAHYNRNYAQAVPFQTQY